MSYFPDSVIYIIIPTADVTTEMENNMKISFNGTKAEARKSNDVPERALLKVKKPISSVFNGYKWYSHAEILTELEKDEWQ